MHIIRMGRDAAPAFVPFDREEQTEKKNAKNKLYPPRRCVAFGRLVGPAVVAFASSLIVAYLYLVVIVYPQIETAGRNILDLIQMDQSLMSDRMVENRIKVFQVMYLFYFFLGN